MTKMAASTTALALTLTDLHPLIDGMRIKAGVPGLAIGVIHQGKVIHEAYLGLRDVEANLPVNRDTLFYVASLTKAMTAAALGILVHQERLEWTTPVHEILPEMSRDTQLYVAKMTVLDILSHRTGKAWADALYLESNNRILLPKEESIPIFDYLPQVEPIRSKYMYNNYAYNIAGLVIEKISGMRWADFMAENLFTPLGMARTFTEQPDDQNVAAPYNILTDASPFRLPFCNVSNNTMMFAGQSVRTTMGDLLKYSLACLQAIQDTVPNSDVVLSKDNIWRPQSHTSGLFSGLKSCLSGFCGLGDNSSSADSCSDKSSRYPIREMITIVSPHIARPVQSLLEQTYALGWNRTQLPGSLDFGWNKQAFQLFPLLGQRYPGKLAIWHGGNMPGTTSALCLLPESQTAVVVMQNSLGLCDVADWTCQLVIDAIMLGEPAQDYLTLVSRCVDHTVKSMTEVEEQLRKERILETKPRDLEAYTGRYCNRIKNWFIDIKVLDGQLYLEFLGRADERYQLQHYHYDTFTWNMSYNQMVKRGQYIRAYPYYRLEFETAESKNSIVSLRWRHDKSVPNGETFLKKME